MIFFSRISICEKGQELRLAQVIAQSLVCILVLGIWLLVNTGWSVNLCLWRAPCISSRPWCHGCSYMVQSSSPSSEGQISDFMTLFCPNCCYNLANNLNRKKTKKNSHLQFPTHWAFRLCIYWRKAERASFIHIYWKIRIRNCKFWIPNLSFLNDMH